MFTWTHSCANTLSIRCKEPTETLESCLLLLVPNLKKAANSKHQKSLSLGLAQYPMGPMTSSCRFHAPPLRWTWLFFGNWHSQGQSHGKRGNCRFSPQPWFLRLSHGDPNIIPGFCPVEMTQQLTSQWIFFTLLPRKRQMRLSGNRVPQSYGLSRYTWNCHFGAYPIFGQTQMLAVFFLWTRLFGSRVLLVPQWSWHPCQAGLSHFITRVRHKVGLHLGWKQGDLLDSPRTQGPIKNHHG